MKNGKLNWNVLKDIIDSNKSVSRDDVRIRSNIGEDCSVVNFGDYECVLSTDPITGAEKSGGSLAVHINCNDIASCGVEPVGILVTILVPEFSKLEDINQIMREISTEAKKLNIEILGGHTEVTSAVNKTIISCTVIGKGKKGEAISTLGSQEEDDIIVTKNLCLEGTYILVNDYLEKVKKFLSKEEITEAKNYISYISVLKEGVIGGKFGVNSMHDITEGGVLGALWEISKGNNLGFKVYKEKMPISQVTKKVCSHFDVDPLRFISSGSMLITTKNGDELIKLLNKEGIKATKIGKIIKEQKGILINNNKEELVSPPQRDELYVFIDKLSN
ncbi:hydrogenase expression/formation protein HypE [Clostridium acetireducens DSM 10703]|uniref:Hydrogenase expression/formation protein HypE n=1 Tax=Clostridium acetireducens DSM 10703 TaxID=1121290 RepID=A0A1E8EZE2_9CLOT|nr:AIR synthase family protein [Clostridium acetireducens]OFI06249.1 hydrogenase expression/formation protein HypE [Clostridium acetireducens DSM 10703]